MRQNDSDPRGRWGIGRPLAIAGVAIAVPIVPFLLVGELPGDRWLGALDEHAWAFAGAGAGVLALDALAPVPSSVVGTLLGARLGAPGGACATFVGLMTGQSLAYFLARRAVRAGDRPPSPFGPGAVALFATRPVPILAEAMAIAAGASGLRPRAFVTGCGLGNAAYALALAWTGAALAPDAGLWPALAVAFAVPALAWVAWRMLHRR